MNEDGNLQCTDFSVAELKEALATIDRERYPQNFARLAGELAARHEPQAPVVQDKPAWMPSISQSDATWIFNAGIALLVAGGALFYWSARRFDGLPNYQRIAIPIPMFVGMAMMQVQNLRNWYSLAPIARVRAFMQVAVPPVLAVASLVWLLFWPDARG